MFEGKSFKQWLVVFGVGVSFVVLASVADHYINLGLGQYVRDVLQLLGIGGGMNQGRNIIADHVTPAWQSVQIARSPSAPPTVPQ